jgi:two-component system, OmpR family, heavy metal sensor histidine kinase CusS
MKAPASLTTRVSLLFAVAAACVLLVAGVLFEHAAENHFLDNDTLELNGKMELMRNVLAGVTAPDSIAQLPTRVADAMLGHPGIAIAVAASDGAVLFSTGPAEVVKHLLESAEPGRAQPTTWSSSDRVYRFVANRLPLGISGAAPARVAIALDITSDRDFMSAFREFLWFGMALAMVVMALLGWAAVYRGLLPLRELSAMFAAISAERLDKPLPEAGVAPELRELVLAFNRMLARLDESFRRLSEFSSDLAHELRTPIHNLLIQTQVTLSRERDVEEYRANLQFNLEELERLSRTASDMLFLARADHRLIAPKREPIALHDEVGRLLAFYEAYAGDRGVALTQSGAATISGDRLMIQRALSNLLSNAVRFTPAGGAVAVSISEGAEAAQVSVTNPGPEIPAEHLSRIFERLYRIDPSRREGEAEHAGLGLAIAKSIIEMHAGSIGVESAGGETRFTVTLPRAQTVQARSLRAPARVEG